MKDHPEIEALVGAVMARCNQLYLRKVFVWGVAVVALVAALGCLLWVGRGESVPAVFLPVVLVMGLALGAAFYVHGRMDHDGAARFCDEHFELKDAVTSALFLQNEEGGTAADLQWRWLKDRIGACRVSTIMEPFPRWLAAVGVGMLCLALWLNGRPASAAVIEAREEARETRELVGKSKDALEELIEQLDGEIVAPGEREVLELDEFRKLVKQIDETGDRTEAARQFARIEQKIRDASKALDQRRDMETLQLAASELGKAEETEPRQLGKKLEAKELKEAEEMLKKLAPKKIDPKELKKGEAGNKKMADLKKELARMRAVTKRMAAAGRQRQGAAQAGGGKGNGGANGGGAGAAGGQMAQGGGGEQEPQELEDLMAELDDAAQELEEALEEFEIDPDAEFEDGDFDGPVARANGLLGKLNGKLRKMNARGKALGKLDQLRQGLAQAQGMMQGEQMMLGLAQAAGGRAPGSGSSWSERKERDDSQKNGGMAQLKGQHGAGPSLSSVEEAESGTGVSGRRGAATEREFAREVESFVQRDDVPEALKLGVRNYFENVQRAASRPEANE